MKIMINNDFLKGFFLLTLRSYGTDLPRGRGRLTLREDLTLSQILSGANLCSVQGCG